MLDLQNLSRLRVDEEINSWVALAVSRRRDTLILNTQAVKRVEKHTPNGSSGLEGDLGRLNVEAGTL